MLILHLFNDFQETVLMRQIDPTTFLMLLFGTLDAITAAGLMLLVIGHAPSRLVNQLLAGMLLCVTLYSVLLDISRLLTWFTISVQIFWAITISLYVWMTQFALAFTLVFTQAIRSPRWKLTLIICLIFALAQTFSLFQNISNPPGLYSLSHLIFLGAFRFSFISHVPALAILIVPTLTIGLALVAVVRTRNSYARALLPAWLGLLAATWGEHLSLALMIEFINVGALLLALAIMARAVLRAQVFSPLLELNAELRENYRQLSEIADIKAHFLNNVRQDLQIPVRAIVADTQSLLHESEVMTDIQRDRLGIVLRNSQDLMTLITDMLDLNQISSGQLTLEKSAVSVAALLDPVLKMIDPMANEKGLMVKLIEESDLPMLWVDPMRARQILSNMLSNAVKFTLEGSVTVHVARADDQRVKFEIIDTGIGIPPEYHDAIFEVFRQVDNNATRRGMGTGLGLSITRQLVELHGGSIHLNSEVGKGTTFCIELPVASPDQLAMLLSHTGATLKVESALN